MKKILPYLKYIVPIACVLSVTIVVFMAMKVDDMKGEREAARTEYNTAEQEFFGNDNNVVENNLENEVENTIENTTDEEKPQFIVTYDVNELIEEENKNNNTVENENTIEEEVVQPSKTTYSEEDKKDAEKMVRAAYNSEYYEIEYKEFSQDGEYIFKVIDKETEETELRAVNVTTGSTYVI